MKKKKTNKQLSDLYCLQGQAHYLYWKVALQLVHLVHINHTATD